MPYLIDGHNLIPKIPGLSLADIEDEKQLRQLLAAFCQRRGTKAEVYFDNAPPGSARPQVYGSITGRFVRQGSSADEAIRRHLKRLGNAATNWTVVSSDKQVRAAARAARAKSISSQEFARQLANTLDAGERERDGEEVSLSATEVDEWLRLFGQQ